ncbi:MAG: Fic family protein [Lachnospiraceae bacterium]
MPYHFFPDGNGRTGRLLVNSGKKNNSRGNPFSWIPAGDLSA